MKFKNFLLALPLMCVFSLTSCVKEGPVGPQGEQGEVGPQGNAGPQGPKGEDGTSSVISIGSNGNWYINGVDTGVKATGDDGKTPIITIGQNGNWFINGVDSGVKASAEDGKTPYIGSNGNWWVDGRDTGVKATGANGKDGKDGQTPYIGSNGNWWINNIDTGIVADSSKADTRVWTAEQKIVSRAFCYETRTIDGISGYVLSNLDSNKIDLTETQDDYWEYRNEITYDEYCNILNSVKSEFNVNVVIPSFINTVPVIGVSNCFKNTKIKSISFSQNNMYLTDSAFEGCEKLEQVDLNNCKQEYLPKNCFCGCKKLSNISLPKTLVRLNERSLANTNIKEIDYSNIEYFGNGCLPDFYLNNHLFLKNNVEYVGRDIAFLIYTESGVDTSNWDEDCSLVLKTNCINNGTYIYSVQNNQATIYRYLGSNAILNVPASIGGYPVKIIGEGFASEFSPENYIDDYIGKYAQINIPNSVAEISPYSLITGLALITVPTSVKKIFVSFDDEEYFLSNFWNFAISENEWLDKNIEVYFPVWNSKNEYSTMSDYDYEELAEYMQFGINASNITYDSISKTFYYNEGYNYSILKNIDVDNENLLVKSSYGGKPVTLVRTNAYCSWINRHSCKFLKIENGITKIQKNAFYLESCEAVYIPSSVTIINKYGFNCSADYYIGARAIPDDWDSNWCSGTIRSITYNVSNNFEIGFYHGFKYFVESDGSISLTNNYNSIATNIVIPRTINGKTVTTIKSGFDDSGWGKKVYIPSTITMIEANAFAEVSSNSRSNNNSYYFNIETSSEPTTWNTNWCYSSYYSSYMVKNYSQAMPLYDNNTSMAYFVNSNNEIELLANYGINKNLVKVPRTITGKKVTKILKGFYSHTETVSVYIPENIQAIESWAFALEQTSSYSYSRYWYFYFEGSSSSIFNPRNFFNNTSYYYSQYNVVFDY